VSKKKSYRQLVQELIATYGTSYQTAKVTGMTQSQLIKHERGQTSDSTFTAQMISVLLNKYSTDEVTLAILESVSRWEKEQDLSKK
jgi:hypothetical protein